MRMLVSMAGVNDKDTLCPGDPVLLSPEAAEAWKNAGLAVPDERVDAKPPKAAGKGKGKGGG